MIPALVLILLSIAVLAIASDQFVTAAQAISRRLGLSDLLSGVVVVGFASSLPELATAVLAAARNRTDIAISSSIGSTAVNATLVASIAALVAAPLIPAPTIRREGLASVLSGIALAVVIFTHGGRIAAGLLIFMFVASTIYVLRGASDHKKHAEKQQGGVTKDVSTLRSSRLVFRGLVALAFTLGSAELFLTSALKVASDLGISGGIVGGVIIAIGASLPEIATAIQATRKGAGAMVIGNVVGASYLNCTLATGIAMMITPLSRSVRLEVPVTVMAGCLLLLWVFMTTSSRLKRSEGVLLLLLYGVFIATVGG